MEEKEAAYALLKGLQISEEDLQFVEMHGFLTRLDIGRYCLRIRENGRSDDALRDEIGNLLDYYRLQAEKPPFVRSRRPVLQNLNAAFSGSPTCRRGSSRC